MDAGITNCEKEKGNIMIVVQRVERDTETADKLLDFVDHFSWQEVKEHTVKAIKTGSLLLPYG
ncbi:MAG: hypothetical protein Q4D24_08130 [Erysipelotrichaceae bacterium]|nr:hypothetical protein [Erysipelotrichaceae bacterium]